MLIVNVRSRVGREGYRPAADALREAGFNLVRTEVIRDPKTLGPALEKAVKEKVPIIAVGGGDGTLGTAATHIIGSESVLGVLPFGTGNEFARDLGIPVDVARAVEVIKLGRKVDVDVGQADDRIFLNVATIGLTTRIAEELDDQAKKWLGKCVYALAAWRALAKIKPFQVNLTLDGEQRSFRTMQVVIGSGRLHAGPVPVTPDASLTDGKLHMYVLEDGRKSALLKYALALAFGRHTFLPEIEVFAVSKGRIETSPPWSTVVDGEVAMKTPFDFKILPGALPVLAPADFKGRKSIRIRAK